MKKLFTFLTAFFITATSFAQIPNAGLETWQTKVGIGFTGPYMYDMPQNWQLGFITGMISGFGMKPNIGKSSTAHTGNWSLQLTSDADSVGADIQARFGLGPNNRPDAFTGSFRTSGPVTNPNNYGMAMVMMTKWNGFQNDTIGFGMADLDSSPGAFKSFTANITYQSPATPDSATIYFLYFPETGNQHVLIDDLAFTSLLGTAKEVQQLTKLNFFPNPVTDQATLTFQAPKAGKGTLIIRDLTGKEVKVQPLTQLQAGANAVTVQAGDLKAGTYLATLQTDQGTQTLRFVKR